MMINILLAIVSIISFIIGIVIMIGKGAKYIKILKNLPSEITGRMKMKSLYINFGIVIILFGIILGGAAINIFGMRQNLSLFVFIWCLLCISDAYVIEKTKLYIK